MHRGSPQPVTPAFRTGGATPIHPRHGMRATQEIAFVVCALSAYSSASAAPVLREADVEIVVTSSIACEVTMTLTVEGASEIDHRVETVSGGGADLVELRGARPVGDVRSIGRTQSLVLRPDQATYSFRYRARQPDDFADRCPIWLPAVPTDGRSRALSIRIRASRGFDLRATRCRHSSGPERRGSTRLGHLPAFVRVPYTADGEALGWGIGRVMDAVAILVFGALRPPSGSGVGGDRRWDSAGASTGSSSPPPCGWRSISCGRWRAAARDRREVADDR